VVFKNNHAARDHEGLSRQVICEGEVPDYIELQENGVSFLAPVQSGQKTGWFYDHRDNRARLNQWVEGKRVLDVFSYIGGWGVQAAVNGASEVVAVDVSTDALDSLMANAAHNGVAEKVSVIEGKAQHALKSLLEQGEKFDVVVMDPPAFIKRRKDQKSGEAAYYHLNEMAVRLLNRDGVLVAGSCSMHLAKQRLIELVQAGARHSDRHAQLVYQGGQGADHPVHPAIMETDYLKAQFYRIIY
jgi:23S rRNA (cytosine1962-C5)-methyltransferase